MLQIITAANTDSTIINPIREEQIGQELEIGEISTISEEEKQAINELTPDILKEESEQEPALDFNQKLNNSINNSRKVKQ
jgi:hypothetical protein